MAKLTLSGLASLTNQTSAITSINNNNSAIAAALELTLSRDGATPNQMEADLDMNSNRVLNLPAPQTDSEPLRLIDVSRLSSLTGIIAPGSSTNNGLVRWVGTTAAQIASSGVTVDSSNNLVIPGNLGITGVATLGSVTVGGTLGVTGVATFTAAPIFNTAIAALSVTTLTPTTIAGNVNFTGTPTFAAASFSGAVSTGALTPTTVHASGAATLDSTLAVTGLATFSNGVQSSSPTAGIGYRTGAGGTVAQGTSKATAVTLNTISGQITLNNAALAAATTVSFTLTNSAIAAGDILVFNHISGGSPGSYLFNAQSAGGSATINVRNITAGSLAEAIVINYAVLKAVTS